MISLVLLNSTTEFGENTHGLLAKCHRFGVIKKHHGKNSMDSPCATLKSIYVMDGYA